MADQSKQKRISGAMTAVLIGTAIVADLLSLIPFVGDFTGPVFWVIVTFYLWTLGYGFSNTKQLVTKALSMVGEMIPAVQALPLTLAGIIILLALIKAEDKIKTKTASTSNGDGKPLNEGGTRSPQNAEYSSQPLNDDGIRPPNGGLA